MSATPLRVLVLGGGGVAGIAWITGVVAGLTRAGVDLSAADAFIGTSAGSSVGAQLAGGASAEALFAEQADPSAASQESFRHYSQNAADAQNRALMDKLGGDLDAARRRIGAFARRSTTPTLDTRRAIVAARLPSHDWPARALGLVAVDVDSGEARVFGHDDGVALVDAVMASCAVPGVWPVVPIGTQAFMDGGIRSLTNADLALDWPAASASARKHVVVLAPLGFGEGNPVSGHLRAELERLRSAGCEVAAVVPDDASQQALGDNVLDPARRAPSAAAGLAQGLALAPALQALWNGS